MAGRDGLPRRGDIELARRRLPPLRCGDRDDLLELALEFAVDVGRDHRLNEAIRCDARFER